MNRTHRLSFVTSWTLIRLPLAFLFLVGAILHTMSPVRFSWLFPFSLLCIVGAAASDLLDGYLARRLGVVTKLGEHIDPLFDRMFFIAAFPALILVAIRNDHVAHAIVLLCIAICLLFRDQCASFVQSINPVDNKHGAAYWEEKARTVLTYVLLCGVYYSEATGRQPVYAQILYIVEALLLLVCLFSIYALTRASWSELCECFRNAMRPGTRSEL